MQATSSGEAAASRGQPFEDPDLEEMTGHVFRSVLLPECIRRQHAGLLRPATNPDDPWANKNPRMGGSPFIWWMYTALVGEDKSPHERLLERYLALGNPGLLQENRSVTPRLRDLTTTPMSR